MIDLAPVNLDVAMHPPLEHAAVEWSRPVGSHCAGGIASRPSREHRPRDA